MKDRKVKDIKLVEIKEEIFGDNRIAAEELRENLKYHKTFLLNLMSSPGSGKTSTILQAIRALKNEFKIGVLEADVDSDVDARTVANEGIDAVQVKTGGFCHMDVSMVKEGLKALNYQNLDLVILENIGNLICPATFDTGAIKNAVILSVPEGDDKPLKYPYIFTTADLLLINKIDTIDFFDFNYELLNNRVKSLKNDSEIIKMSCRTGAGTDNWIEWLRSSVKFFLTR